MLSERVRPGTGARVCVLSRNRKFGRLLTAILADWSLTGGEGGEGAGCDLALVERGLPAPPDVPQLIWLSPLPLGNEPHIVLPLSLVELYHYLEQLFFPTPRRHIRLALKEPIDINVRGVWLTGRLLSISDRGARIACPALLPKGELLQFDFRLGNYPLRVSAQVLYDIPAGDVDGRAEPQAGLLFKPPRPALREAIRRYIEKSFIARACQQAGIADHDPCLSWFDFAADPWAQLGD